MYTMLIDLRATADLLELDTAQLETHLKQNGGLPSGLVEAPIGPLTPSQVEDNTDIFLSSNTQFYYVIWIEVSHPACNPCILRPL